MRKIDEMEEKLKEKITTQTNNIETIKNEMENYIKKFNLLDKNINIWHEKVEKRFNEIAAKKTILMKKALL